ncbi:TPA: glycosyltransferase [Aeromonas hydrophila]|nr:glycosyltransferase [Aeromonas hydrophila]
MLLSVYIISYNHAKFIRKCIESVFNCKDIEYDVTVIDNASSDGSQAIINELSLNYCFKKVLNKENDGLPKTLNKILFSSNCEFICFLAADDYVAFDRFKTQVAFLQNNPEYYGCSGSQVKVNENDECLPRYKQKNIVDIGKKVDASNIFDTSNIIYSPTAIYRKDVLVELGGYDERILIEDLYIYYKAASCGYKFYIIPKLFTYYRNHDGNTHTKFKWMHEQKLKILNEHKGSIHYKKLKKLVLLEGFYSLSLNNKKDALRLLPAVIIYVNSLFLYAGLFKLFFYWRSE